MTVPAGPSSLQPFHLFLRWWWRRLVFCSQYDGGGRRWSLLWRNGSSKRRWEWLEWVDPAALNAALAPCLDFVQQVSSDWGSLLWYSHDFGLIVHLLPVHIVE